MRQQECDGKYVPYAASDWGDVTQLHDYNVIMHRSNSVGYYDDSAVMFLWGAPELRNHVSGLNRPLFLSRCLQWWLDCVNLQNTIYLIIWAYKNISFGTVQIETACIVLHEKKT